MNKRRAALAAGFAGASNNSLLQMLLSYLGAINANPITLPAPKSKHIQQALNASLHHKPFLTHRWKLVVHFAVALMSGRRDETLHREPAFR